MASLAEFIATALNRSSTFIFSFGAKNICVPPIEELVSDPSTISFQFNLFSSIASKTKSIPIIFVIDAG